MKKMKKQAISLIEVMISLTLLSLVLSTLFFWYHTLSKQKEEAGHLRAPLMEERYAHQRLHSLWQKIELPFFSTEEGCAFCFDNGTTPFPELSGKVVGSLYYDAEEHRLCLGIWPLPEKEKAILSPAHMSVLLEEVSECRFKFYYPPDPFKKPVDPEEVGRPRPQRGWQKRWEAGYQKMPALVSIEIKREASKGLKEHQITYCFDLPVKIIYPHFKI